MLHIVLLILKIIGLIILVILGLLLGLLLLVLLVPVRYKIDGSYYEKLQGVIRITWLLHILSIRITCKEDIDVSFRVFGRRLFQGDGEPDSAKEETIRTEPLFHQNQDRKEELEEDLDNLVQIQEIPAGRQEKPGIFQRFIQILDKFKFLIRRVCDTLYNIRDTYGKVLEFIRDEENQKTLKLIWKQAKALVHHVLPGKASGTVVFGFDDPYRTGQVLSAASLFYAWYGGQIALVPMFDQVILEGELKLKGRIRMGTLLWHGLMVYFNKNFRVQLKRLRNQ